VAAHNMRPPAFKGGVPPPPHPHPHSLCLFHRATPLPPFPPSSLSVQVPNLDAAVSTKKSIKQRGVLKSLRMLLAGVTDLLRTAAGQPPIYLPLAGE
jgi:hypothetical protein